MIQLGTTRHKVKPTHFEPSWPMAHGFIGFCKNYWVCNVFPKKLMIHDNFLLFVCSFKIDTQAAV